MSRGPADQLPALRRLLRAFVRLLALIFFRRIEVVRAENVPDSGPVLFAVNHPNGLVDPIFLLGFAARPVSFLAKAPLFTMPLVGWAVRSLDSIPVYRKQDNLPTARNRETFDRARAILAKGGGIAIFPEGTTHSDPQLRELKTGAARIALGAGLDSISIVPTGIYYTEKQTFRSSALVVYGPPIVVASQPVDANGEPDPAAVEALTKRIEDGLDAVTLQAESHAAMELVARAERIFSAGESDLAEEFELRRRFVEGYGYLCAHDPDRLKKLESQVARFDAELVSRPKVTSLWLLLLLPFAILGAIIHWPVYRAIGWLANRFSKGEQEVVATIKVLAAAVFYPLMWIACAAAIAWRLGALSGVLALLALPLLGYLGMRVFEVIDDLIGRMRALTRHDAGAQRLALREDFMRVAEEMERAPAVATRSSP